MSERTIEEAARIWACNHAPLFAEVAEAYMAGARSRDAEIALLKRRVELAEAVCDSVLTQCFEVVNGQHRLRYSLDQDAFAAWRAEKEEEKQ